MYVSKTSTPFPRQRGTRKEVQIYTIRTQSLDRGIQTPLHHVRVETVTQSWFVIAVSQSPEQSVWGP